MFHFGELPLPAFLPQLLSHKYRHTTVRLRPKDIAGRRLDIVIPRGVATDAQKAALAQVRVYGLDNGVMVRIIEVP